MKILYICTHNRCRSILSEAITNFKSKGLLDARSAGSQPTGQVHPLSIQFLREAGVPVDTLKSQSWDEFEDFNPDVVVTVCDSAAGETCPVWFGNSLKVHWSLEDPSKLQGSDEAIAQAFRTAILLITQRVEALHSIAALNRDQWKDAFLKLGAQL